MKELRLGTHRFHDEKELISKHVPTSPNVSIDSITTVLNNLHPIDSLKYLKTHKYTQSQSRLEVPVALKMQATSPKFNYTELKTERKHSKYKGQENVEVSAFDLGKQSKIQESALKILAPSNKNFSV